MGGIFTSRSSSRMAVTASPRVKPGARLKVMVTAGSWLWRATETGPGTSVTGRDRIEADLLAGA